MSSFAARPWLLRALQEIVDQDEYERSKNFFIAEALIEYLQAHYPELLSRHRPGKSKK